MSQRDSLNEEKLVQRLPGGCLNVGNIKFTINQVPETDVLIIQNYLRFDTTVNTRKGFIWKWDMEPNMVVQPGPEFGKIFTHHEIPGESRIETEPPILDWWVSKSYDELFSLDPPAKTLDLSAIASSKDWFPGHQRRNEFVELLAQKIPSLDLYGFGRPRELIDKWDGLASYRYSIAIENISKPDYWTEKITDCFMSFTVPFYFGATNIQAYFPEESFIWLPIDEPHEAVRIVEETLFGDDWGKRLPALVEARRRFFERYSLFGQVSRLIEVERQAILAAPRVTTRVRGKYGREGGWGLGIGGLRKLSEKGWQILSQIRRSFNRFRRPSRLE